ncbi:hypothetical protein JCM5353_001598, partial [Sporobolomyces roseus]
MDPKASHPAEVVHALAVWSENPSKNPFSPPTSTSLPPPHSRFESPNARFVRQLRETVSTEIANVDFESPSAFHVIKVLTYILDSGASDCFTTDLSHLQNYIPFTTPRKIVGAFGSCGEALGSGTLTIDSPFGNPIKIPNVLYAPTLGVNLISMTQMMLMGYKFENTTTTLSIFDPNKIKVVDLLVAKTIEIKASLPPQSPSTLSSYPTSTDDPVRWHHRLGHPSDHRLKELLGWWDGNKKISSVCDVCQAAKGTRRNADSSSSDPATKKLQRVAADTWTSPVRGMRGE